MKVKIKKLHPAAITPQRATSGAACFDLHAVESLNCLAFSTALFRTGLAFEIPPGSVMLIFSRSGHGFRNDMRLSNCVGVIDADYRGEVMVKLRNDSAIDFGFGAGDRIAQAMILDLPYTALEVVDTLTETARGDGGFGSTGN